jgi:hypothetical protein
VIEENIRAGDMSLADRRFAEQENVMGSECTAEVRELSDSDLETVSGGVSIADSAPIQNSPTTASPDFGCGLKRIYGGLWGTTCKVGTSDPELQHEAAHAS